MLIAVCAAIAAVMGAVTSVIGLIAMAKSRSQKTDLEKVIEHRFAEADTRMDLRFKNVGQQITGLTEAERNFHNLCNSTTQKQIDRLSMQKAA